MCAGLLWHIRRVRRYADEVSSVLILYRQAFAEVADVVGRVNTLDEKLSEHVVELTKRAGKAQSNIVVLTDELAMQRVELDVTVDTVTELQAKITKLVALTTMVEQRHAGTEQAVTQLQRGETVIQQRLAIFAQQILDDDETTAIMSGASGNDAVLDNRRQALEKKLSPLMYVGETPLLNVARFEHALRGAADFREFVEMYVDPSG